jgi:hypothetical protein
MSSIKMSSLRGTGGKNINLYGPVTVLPNTSNEYTVTDYDSFSMYTVSTSVGTISMALDKITLAIPNGTPDGVLNMKVARNGVERLFSVAVDSSGAGLVVTPSIISPVDGATGVSSATSIQATAFATVPANTGTFVSSRWQVARDAEFSDIVDDVVLTTGDKTRFTPTSLTVNTPYYARVKYISSSQETPWSSVTSFTTSSVTISKPTVNIVGGQSNVKENPTFNGSAFVANPTGSDSHISSNWVVRKASDNSVVWQLLNSTQDKLATTIPQGILVVSTTYTVEVQYNGSVGQSMFSDKLTFATAANFYPSVPGTPFGGGYYAGANIVVDGMEYALIVAPKALGGELSTAQTWNNGSETTLGAGSLNDGFSNTTKMAAAGSSVGLFAKNLTIGGFTDWYIPSRAEEEIMYRYLKRGTGGNDTNWGPNPYSRPVGGVYTSSVPAQTVATLFKTGGAEELVPSRWTSSEYSNQAWMVIIEDGSFFSGNKTPNTSKARAVRRVLIGPAS